MKNGAFFLSKIKSAADLMADFRTLTRTERTRIMYSFTSRVRFSEVDTNLELTPYSILNYFQDCSTFHSEAAHMSIDALADYGYAWLLASWQVVINRKPRLGETIKISTWPHAFKGFLAYRNFSIEDAEGNVCAYANTIWTFLNVRTVRPAKILPEVAMAYPLSDPFPMEMAPRKVALAGEGIFTDSITVCKHHLDLNQHVNNAMYILMAQEYLPEGFEIKQMRVEYKNAAVLGDVIQPMLISQDDLFQVALKNTDGGIYAVVEFTRR